MKWAKAAATGHNGLLGMHTNGIYSGESPKARVLVHFKRTTIPHAKKVKSERVRCREELKVTADGGTTFAFRRNPKNAQR